MGKYTQDYPSKTNPDRYRGYVPQKDSPKHSHKKSKPIDTFSLMLFFQIKIVLIILLLFGITRFTGGVLYIQAKQFSNIICGTVDTPLDFQNIPSLTSLLEPIEKFGQDMGEKIKGIINKNITVDEEPEVEHSVEPPASIGESQDVKIPTSAAITSGWWESAMYKAAYPSLPKAIDAAEGAGGLLQKQNDLNTFDFIEAPEGAMFAPIMINAKIRMPIYGKVTSNFGYRYHPVTFEADFHSGLDIAAPEGTAIHAALPGEVIEAGWSDSYGYRVIIKHSNNLKTTYNHCSKLLVETGWNIAQGDRIALVGSTGISTGPHLHFEVLVNDKKADPLWIIPKDEEMEG